MKTAQSLVALGVVLALGGSQAVWAAQQKEEDSAYQWGRWAVLSPAAGGEPYVAPQEPDAAKNARPGEADEFQPKALVGDVTPPVEIDGFCDAGAACGYATHSQNTGEEERLRATAVPEGYDLSDQDPDGPVLARFNLETFPVEAPADVPLESEETQFEAAVVVEGGPGGARFQVYDTGNDDFPDIDSVDMEGDGYFSGTERSRTGGRQDDGSKRTVITTQVSTLEQTDDFNGVATGSWLDETETVTAIDEGEGLNLQFDFSSPGGHFVFGKTATIDQMETFAAGNVTAVYQGAVIDYGSAVTMEFDLGEKTVHGVFASENGFNGFQADGRVDGINFAGSDGDKRFTGSFFSAGENVSGAVNNGSQLGVFSADHVHPEVR